MNLAKAVLGKRPEQIAPIFGETQLDIDAPIEGSDRRYIEFPAMGLTIALKNDIAFCLQLFSADFDQEEFAQYEGPLPGNVKFSSSRKEVLEAMGKPVNAGKIFDRYRIDGYNVHFEYTGHDTISLVSIFNDA